MNAELKGYWVAITAYGTIVGALYQFGFWGAFELNVLEFIGLTDLFKLAIYPLLISLAFIMMGYLHGELFSGELPVGGGRDTRIARFGLTHWRRILYLVGTAVLLAPFLIESPRKWFVVAVGTSILCIPLGYVDAVIGWLPNAKTRFTVLWIAPCVALMSFGFGRINADRAKQGTSDLIVDVSPSALPLTGKPERPVVFLGRLGDYFAVYETLGERLILISNGEIKLLALVKNPRRT